VGFRIGDLNTRDLCRAERFLRERDGLFAVGNDVDFFAAQFTNDGLNAHAFHTNACAHRIDILITTEHGDLRAFTRFASGGADLHRSVVDFRNFHFEKPLHQRGIGA
jgi:hypothetical protein